MNKRSWFRMTVGALLALGLALVSGCDDDNGGIDLSNIGDNNPDVYLALGDSLITGVGGVAPYPSRLSAMKGKTVVNAGQGGARAAWGASVIGGLLQRHKPAVVLVTLGVNDAIHGSDPSQTIAALQSIVAQCNANQSKVIVGNVIPMEGGRAIYNGTVEAINARMKEVSAPKVNLYKDFNGKSALYLDGLHPSDQGAQVMALAYGEKL